MAYDNLHLDKQLCFALYAASNAVTRQYRAQLRELGLTYPQYLALLTLWDHGPTTVKRMAGTLQIESATLTPLLKRLQAAGLVTRERNLEDERCLIVRPTAKAAGLRRRLSTIQDKVACATGLNQREFTALRGKLHALASHMNAAGDTAAR